MDARGDPAAEIVRAAEERGCGLIVISSHGRTGLGRILFGSTAESVVRHGEFFLALDAFNPGEAIWLAIAMGVVALACMVHFVRVRRALDDHQHDELARTVHAMREKRGF